MFEAQTILVKRRKNILPYRAMSSLAWRISPIPSSCSSDSAANLLNKQECFILENDKNLETLLEKSRMLLPTWVGNYFKCKKYIVKLQTWLASAAFFHTTGRVLWGVLFPPSRTSPCRSGRASRGAASSCCSPSSARSRAGSKRPSYARPPWPCSWWSEMIGLPDLNLRSKCPSVFIRFPI